MDRPSIPLFAFLTTYRDQHSSRPTDITKQLLPLIDVVEIDHAGVDIIVAGKIPDKLCILVLGSVDVILPNGLCVAQMPNPNPDPNPYPTPTPNQVRRPDA